MPAAGRRKPGWLRQNLSCDSRPLPSRSTGRTGLGLDKLGDGLRGAPAGQGGEAEERERAEVTALSLTSWMQSAG